MAEGEACLSSHGTGEDVLLTACKVLWCNGPTLVCGSCTPDVSGCMTRGKDPLPASKGFKGI